MNADQLCAALRASRGFAHKRDVSDVLRLLQRAAPDGAAAGAAAADGPAAGTTAAGATAAGTTAAGATAAGTTMAGATAAGTTMAGATALAGFDCTAIPLGDDCAAIPDGDGFLLLAIEGFVEDFVAHSPWFAGYCGVMVNVSDIYAMGGRPLAVVDALWSCGMEPAAQILEGLTAAACRYGVPLVGGHSNNRAQRGQLAVAILGRARRLLSSFAAKPEDRLVMAVDLRGHYEEPFPYWNASSGAPAGRLREDLEVLPGLAEDGLCAAAKDISMAGALGTLLMMLECSRVGATIDVGSIPHPGCADDAALLRWLSAFPSYGFVLSVDPRHVAAVVGRFARRGLAVATIGEVTVAPQVILRHGDTARLWDFDMQPFMAPSARPPPPPSPRPPPQQQHALRLREPDRA